MIRVVLVMFSMVMAFAIVGAGWVMNLQAIILAARSQADFTVLMALRFLGIILPPVGGLLGWLL